MINYKLYTATLLLVFGLFVSPKTHAEIVLPRVIGSGMVLQQQKLLPIWGTGTPGEKVSVKFGKQLKNTVTDGSGNWKVVLNPLSASEKPETMTISGTNTITLDNILVGEVWICSGQSNMEYEMRKNSKVRKPDSLDKNSPVDELAHAHDTSIRIFWVNQKNLQTKGNYLARWNLAQDSALKSFSAAGYFFAKNLRSQLHVPVGVVCAAISGSAIEPWIPEGAYSAIPYFQHEGAFWKEGGKFYHSMIEPLAPFAIKGFLWYQGEANMVESISYAYKMEALFNSWRNLWNEKMMPVYYVQIVPYNYDKLIPGLPAERLAEFWEVQTMALAIPNTGMIVTTDLTDITPNLHPPYKWEVGRRLALVALAKTYGKNLVYSGPMYQSMLVVGNKIALSFTGTGSGLVSKDGKALSWFTIAGADGKFVPADAVIVGNKVMVSSRDVPVPVAVRFAWNQLAGPNLFNKEGLPAGPFRTDNPLKFTAN
ncbi:sialate O-acetylesterase [Mucilaginibacter gracilis]|uniref:Sialate O-acetylesterase n=1 Tax=Mucilaginibacter gracilis TaxID=423350 RepID=A0A495J6H1_9SPHI|nr:sialate O-acetylesterase [Mucilaginibacter gracilis]RKR84333.1 sialate O-acetylesterase [Mucilaginibacter gracilis]